MKSSRSDNRLRCRAKLAALGLINLIVLSPATPAGSAPASSTVNFVLAPVSVIEVNTTGDEDNLNANAGCDVDANVAGDQCTLRAAIQRANAVAGDDTIVFNIPSSQANCDAGGKCTVFLKKALPDLSTNVSLLGPGAAKLSVSHDLLLSTPFRIFNVTTAALVIFSGISIERGDAGSDVGGGINNAGSATINVNECSIFANRAAQGGGIFNLAGTLNLSNSRLTFNTANSEGGGFYNAGAGNVTIVSTFFLGDQAGGNGGAIHNNGAGTVNVTNSSFFQNVAGFSVTSARGGGVMNAGAGALKVSNSTFLTTELTRPHPSGRRAVASPAPRQSKSTIVAFRGPLTATWSQMWTV